MAEDKVVRNQQMAEACHDETAEVVLTEEIATLWSAQRDHAAAARRTREELKTLRRDLGQRLHAVKVLLVQTGRGGRWAAYLREQRIPRATANRLVQRHEETLQPVTEKRLSETISPSIEQEIEALFKKLRPQLLKVLTTQEAAFQFVVEMLWLPGVDGDVTDKGALIYRPGESGSCEAAAADREPLVPVEVE